jgi:uncharacterized membrane protein
MKLARLHSHANIEPYWHVQLAVLSAIFLQIMLNDNFVVGPKYAIAGVEFLLLLVLTLVGKKQHRLIKHIRRSLAVALIALISLVNIISLVLVINELFGGQQVTGKELLLSGLAIYLTNIIIFGLWYWELDSNGNPAQSPSLKPIDFMFPQMAAPDQLSGAKSWAPTFTDYLYVSMTNATAFSPTDTMPLTHRAKALMGLQSTVSLITVALVAARAVNILA